MKKSKLLTVSLTVLWFAAFFILISCDDDNNDDDNDKPSHQTTAWEWPLATLKNTKFPTEMNIPLNNPMTKEGVEFGRWLFYDGRVSGRTHADSLMSCATCHIQRNAFEVGNDHPTFINGRPFGLSGIHTPHSMLPMINLVFNNTGYLWNGKVRKENTFLWKDDPRFDMTNIESLVWMGIAAPHEMLGHPDKTTALLNTIPNYRELCYNAFGDSTITYERMSKAIAQFVRTLISYNSKFHKWIRKEVNYTVSEIHGFQLYTQEAGDCFHCHGGTGNPLLTTNLFYNNGLDDTLTTNSDTRDRYHVTFDLKDIGAYKATTLLNCELYGPYMHDGRFETLEEVLEHYSSGVKNTSITDPLMEYAHQGGVHLTQEDKQDLLAFLKTLTDYEFISNPDFAKPTDLDDKWVNQE